MLVLPLFRGAYRVVPKWFGYLRDLVFVRSHVILSGMIDFDRWFANQKPLEVPQIPQVVFLPIYTLEEAEAEYGVFTDAYGEYFAHCIICDQPFQLPNGLELKPGQVGLYCNGSSFCCP